MNPGCERGSVTVVTAGLLLIALALSLGMADLTRVLVASARAQTAADAAALAATQELALAGGRDPAEVAAEYAARNGAGLIDCACSPGAFEATTLVRVAVGELMIFPDDRTVSATARAAVDLPQA